MIETLVVKELGEPKGPFSMGKTANGFLFLSGQAGIGDDGELVAGGIEEETEQTIKNIARLLNSAGLGFENAVDVNVFLTDINDFSAMNAVYAKYFTSKPARTCVAVNALPFGAHVEIRVTALK